MWMFWRSQSIGSKASRQMPKRISTGSSTRKSLSRSERPCCIRSCQLRTRSRRWVSTSHTHDNGIPDHSFDQLKRLYPFIHKFKVFELLDKCDNGQIKDLIQKFFNKSCGMQTEHYNYLFSTLPLKAVMRQVELWGWKKTFRAAFAGSISNLMEDQQLQVPETYFSLQQFTSLTSFALKQTFPSITIDEYASFIDRWHICTGGGL